MWGYQRHGIAPDIVTMGKPMGNGLPIAGLVARQDVLEDFGRKARYFNTFGGNPVCVAAASAVLDVLEAEGLPANAAATGAYLKDALSPPRAWLPGARRRARRRPLPGHRRRRPGTTGEPSGELAAAIVNGMRERRVLISATGPAGQRPQGPPAAPLRPGARRPVPHRPPGDSRGGPLTKLRFGEGMCCSAEPRDGRGRILEAPRYFVSSTG